MEHKLNYIATNSEFKLYEWRHIEYIFVDHFGNPVTHNDVIHYAIINRSIIFFVVHSFVQSFFLLYSSNSVRKQICWVFRNYYACMSVCVKPCPRHISLLFWTTVINCIWIIFRDKRCTMTLNLKGCRKKINLYMLGREVSDLLETVLV